MTARIAFRLRDAVDMAHFRAAVREGLSGSGPGLARGDEMSKASEWARKPDCKVHVPRKATQ